MLKKWKLVIIIVVMKNKIENKSKNSKFIFHNNYN